MRTRRERMSIEAFHALPQHFAWKHEYLDGVAYIRPRELAAVATLALETVPAPAAPPEGLELGTLDGISPDALAQLYRLAFRDTPELCDYVGEILEREIRRWLVQDIARAHPATRILHPRRHPRAVAALVLIKEKPGGLLLDTLAVRPRWQRRGAATYLLREVAAQLRTEGEIELKTTYHPANAASVAWHAAQGFVELPCLSHARQKLRAARANGENTTALEAEVQRLEAKGEREGHESVEPLLRL